MFAFASIRPWLGERKGGEAEPEPDIERNVVSQAAD